MDLNEIEEARIIEVYKYFEPAEYSVDRPLRRHGFKSELAPEPNISPERGEPIPDRGDSGQPVVSPHVTLTAFCQLAAIQLGVQRVGISLIGRYQQYVLAEATRTLNLTNTQRSQDAEDGLWIGLAECKRAGGLCENAVALPPSTDALLPPFLTIKNLDRDDRFKSAYYVQKSPYFKFYCATPITTDKGYNIGSFCVIDTRPLDEFTDEMKILMGTLATQTMKYLETRREAQERRKAAEMNQALSAFVEGPVESIDEVDFPKTRRLSKLGQNNRQSQQGLIPELNESHSLSAQNITETDKASSPRKSSHRSIDREIENSRTPLPRRVTPPRAFGPTTTRKDVFERAVQLIREGASLRGCVIFETGPFMSGGLNAINATPLQLSTTNSRIPQVEVLGMAFDPSAVPGSEQRSFIIPEEDILNDISESYPRGTLWTYSEDGQVLTPEWLRPFTGESSVKSRAMRHRLDGERARTYFPHVRQLLFVPIFDASLGRITATCFAYNTELAHVLTRESELTFLRNFITNVESEISRLSAKAADKSKSDFISSISHELRSPLHGILAAAEFLEDTTLDSYQRSLIGIQASCGRTLLQVIEHVLDFSKINTFEKNKKVARSRPRSGSASDPNLQNLYVVCDIAELCEEVVEGSVVGRAHMSQDATRLPSVLDAQTRTESEASSTDDSAVRGLLRNVATVIDIDYSKDWTFVTQPGAFRRILMNVLGNSLKYTAEGCVSVRLQLLDADADDHEEASDAVVQLTVTDTGRGISPEFLRQKLFVPFNQEDHLATGCGLGLSIVKALVDELSGTLDIRSELGSGTTVSIALPVRRGPQVSPSLDNPLSLVESQTSFALPKGKQAVGYVGFLVNEKEHLSSLRQQQSSLNQMIKSSVAKIMQDWLRMDSIKADSDLGKADYIVVLADERLGEFIRPFIDDLTKKQPRVLALLPSEMKRREVEEALGTSINAFEVLGAPFGPRKLAKAVAACEAAAAKVEQSNNARATVHVRKGPIESSVPKELVGTGSELLKNRGITDQTSPSLGNGPGNSIDNVATRLDGMSIQEPIGIDDRPIVISPNERTQPLFAGTPTKEIEYPEVQPQFELDGSQVRESPSLTRVLLVDDNNINLRLLETFIRKKNETGNYEYEYECAENGLQAVEAAERSEIGYNVIFMDLSMPVMDGLEATKKIREMEARKRQEATKAGRQPAGAATVVALTGLANNRDRANAFGNGVDVFMTKPVKFKAVGELLDQLTAKKNPSALASPPIPSPTPLSTNRRAYF